MTGFKKGTGSLDFEDGEQDETPEDQEQAPRQTTEPQQEHEQAHPHDQGIDSAPHSEPATDSGTPSIASPSSSSPEFDMANLPYLVQRQMRGASVNADRTNQLLLEVRQSVKENEETFLGDLQDLVDGPVYKGDAREAAMIVAHENPELVAEKLREWGIDYLDT